MKARLMWESPAASRLRSSISLLTERRLPMYAALDGLFLFLGITLAFGGASDAKGFYPSNVLLPLLLIVVPMTAEAVAVERRSGTLDLALTSPAARFYFERRIGAVAALMIVQSWLIVIVPWLIVEKFPLSAPFVQIPIVVLFVCAVVLNWAVRLKTAGAVSFATYITVAAFGPWVFSNPIRPLGPSTGRMTLPDYIDFAQQNLVLAAGALIFYLYARQRLARPEAIIS